MSCRCVSIVLCLAPMALMVGAAGVDYCSHSVTHVDTSTAVTARQIAPATSTHCPTIQYIGCRKTCYDCGSYLGTATVNHASEHRWVNDICAYCDYEG